MSLFFALLGIVYAIGALFIAWVIFRRPLTDKERPWVALIFACVALAALAYRLDQLAENLT